MIKYGAAPEQQAKTAQKETSKDLPPAKTEPIPKKEAKPCSPKQ